MNTDELNKYFEKDVTINEIVRLAFWKYRLSGKRSMNTYIFSEAKNNNLSDDELNKIIDILNKKIQNYKQEQEQKQNEELEKELIKTLKIQEKRNQKTKSVGNGKGSLYYSETQKCWIFQYHDTQGKRQTIKQKKNESEEDFKIRVAEIKKV